MNNDRPIPDIVETLKTQHIAPTPKWVIRVKRWAFWTMLVGMGTIGALFLSLGLIDLLDIGPDIFYTLGIRRLPFLIFFSTPILWMLLFILSVLFGIIAFRNTRYGYRYRILFVGSLTTLVIVTLALLAHTVRLDDRFDRAIESGMPESFREILPSRETRWMSPQNGVLAGKILETRDTSFTLETPRKETWNVLIANTTRKGRFVRLETGFPVLIIGTPKEANVFEAVFIRPLRNNQRAEKIRANFPEVFPYNTMRGAHDTIIR